MRQRVDGSMGKNSDQESVSREQEGWGAAEKNGIQSNKLSDSISTDSAPPPVNPTPQNKFINY